MFSKSWKDILCFFGRKWLFAFFFRKRVYDEIWLFRRLSFKVFRISGCSSKNELGKDAFFLNIKKYKSAIYVIFHFEGMEWFTFDKRWITWNHIIFVKNCEKHVFIYRIYMMYCEYFVCVGIILLELLMSTSKGNWIDNCFMLFWKLNLKINNKVRVGFTFSKLPIFAILEMW